jgi:ABC-type nitrate/sulfonate/bicarbonate transport system substrate-binding protein
MPISPTTRVLLAAMGALIAASASAGPLTIAIADLPAFSPALVAAEAGYFAAEGLDVNVIRCVNGRRCLQHLTDGEAALATVADIPLVMVAHAGKPFGIVTTMATSRRETRLIVRSDRAIRSASDLKGKRLGFIRGTSAHYFVDNFLTLSSLKHQDLTLVPLDPARAAEQLVAGEVDAAGLYNPHGPRALEQLGDKALQLFSLSTYTITFNLVAQPAVSDEDLRKALRALERAMVLIRQDPQAARTLVGARLQLEPSVIRTMWGDYDFRLALDQALITTLESESRWAVREGLAENKAMPNYLDRVRDAPLRSIDRRAVTVIK